MFGWPQRHRSVITLEGSTGKPVTKCLILFGLESSQSTQRVWKSVRDARNLGVKVICVDPRRTPTAELADIWLQIRPATDTALEMAMINVIIREELYDKEFVANWCHGFDKLAERARDYPPERVAEICWVPAEQIIEAARMYALNKPALSLNGMGQEHHTNTIEAIQARLILTAITGNIDIEGGQYLPGPARCVTNAEIALEHILPPEQKAKQLGADRFKLLCWPGRDLIQSYVQKGWGKRSSSPRAEAGAHAPTVQRAMITGKPYPVRAMITVANNPIVSNPNTKMVYKALRSLDLYVVADFWMTPSAEIADYVLPSACWLERPYFDVIGNGADCGMMAGEQALPSVAPGRYDRKIDFNIYRELAVRMGQEEYWPWKTLEETFDYRLKPLEMTYKDFMARGGFDFPPPRYRKYEKMGFATPTGKVELSSTIFEKLGYDPLPRYEEAPENPISQPELAKEYPFMLITGGRFLPMYHSEHRQIESLRRRHPDPIVQIHPETATGLDIGDGDWVWIESPRGRIRMKCQHFTGIHPKVISCEHGWWFPELPGEEPWLHGLFESNANVLTNNDPDVCNKLSGGWPLKMSLCKVYRCQTYGGSSK